MIELVQEKKVVKYEHLDRAVKMLSYDEYSLEQQFPNSVFTEPARAKLRECLGLIYGVALQDKAAADEQAKCLFKYLDWPAGEHGKCVFGADTTPFSFSFSKYYPIAMGNVRNGDILLFYPEGSHRAGREASKVIDGKSHYFYRSINGGLIYHGPRTWNNWTVRIGGGDQWWSSHT